MKNRIFISYRRDDSKSVTGRLHDYLEDAFGADIVFKDIHDILPGADFGKVLVKAILDSDIVLLVIGIKYTSSLGKDGQARIMNSKDFVNMEAATAIAFRDKKMVIPLLVEDATMPSPADLPDNLQLLPSLNAMVLSTNNWRTDVQKLIKVLQDRLKWVDQKNAPQKTRHQSSQRKTAPSVQKAKSGGIGTFGKVAIGFVLAIIFLTWIGSMLEDETTTTSPQSIVSDSPSFQSFTGYISAQTTLNVRNRPGTDGTNVLTALDRGEQITIIESEQVKGSTWYQIQMTSGTGWVSGNFVSKEFIASREKADEPIQTTLDQIEQSYTTPQTTSSYAQFLTGSWSLIGARMGGLDYSVQDLFGYGAYITLTFNGRNIQYNSYSTTTGAMNNSYPYTLSDNYIDSEYPKGPITYIDATQMQITSTMQTELGNMSMLLFYQRIN